MSKVSPVAAVSTPPVPLFWSRRLSRILEKRGSCECYKSVICAFPMVLLLWANKWEKFKNPKCVQTMCLWFWSSRKKSILCILSRSYFFVAEGIVFSPNILPWVCCYGNTKRKAQQCGSLSKYRWHQWTQRRKKNFDFNAQQWPVNPLAVLWLFSWTWRYVLYTERLIWSTRQP